MTSRWLTPPMTLIVLALAACGGSDVAAQSDSVASLATTSADGSSVTQTGDSAEPSGKKDKATAGESNERPQLRLDDSPEDVDRKQTPYLACLKANGHRMLEARGPLSLDQSDDSLTAKAATKKCAGKLWRIPPELDPERNPDFADDFRAEIKCLNSRGLPVKAIDEEGSWTYVGTSKLSAEKSEQVQEDCQMEAYGGKK
jgi:hypothetical protein